MTVCPLRILCTCGETLLVRDGLAHCNCGLAYRLIVTGHQKEQQAA